MDAVDALRAFFILAACTILAVSLPDSLRSRFVPYGARATSTAAAESETSATATATSTSESTSASSFSASPVTRALDYAATLRVPHSYFIQFYVISVLSSIFWALQLLSHGRAFQAIAARIRPEHLDPAVSINQVMLCWSLLLIQGVRRLHECLSFSKPSASKMWFVHWLAGVGFYLAVAVAVWIEGAGGFGIFFGFEASVDWYRRNGSRSSTESGRFQSDEPLLGSHAFESPHLPRCIWYSTRLPPLSVLTEEVHLTYSPHV
ncbi:putative 3-oxo-5-alpha-steroid 4-dehydrogenase [Aspergillus mulundensis]|uniref:Polyprenal reductase n=1 Tax=Aspergillus mulundensis TaxID=1810919 RepID=A0A3D8T6D7_9EURO|nr:hypothetical protein DSM5745_00900 [Aspergillus mulundensis]RDW93578.1 hypothetical protein DSM5745_00900 [Aspergillus mulundensis]